METGESAWPSIHVRLNKEAAPSPPDASMIDRDRYLMEETWVQYQRESDPESGPELAWTAASYMTTTKPRLGQGFTEEIESGS